MSGVFLNFTHLLLLQKSYTSLRPNSHLSFGTRGINRSTHFAIEFFLNYSRRPLIFRKKNVIISYLPIVIIGVKVPT
jgi:hypothetical protein